MSILVPQDSDFPFPRTKLLVEDNGVRNVYSKKDYLMGMVTPNVSEVACHYNMSQREVMAMLLLMSFREKNLKSSLKTVLTSGISFPAMSALNSTISYGYLFGIKRPFLLFQPKGMRVGQEYISPSLRNNDGAAYGDDVDWDLPCLYTGLCLVNTLTKNMREVMLRKRIGGYFGNTYNSPTGRVNDIKWDSPLRELFEEMPDFIFSLERGHVKARILPLGTFSASIYPYDSHERAFYQQMLEVRVNKGFTVEFLTNGDSDGNWERIPITTPYLSHFNLNIGTAAAIRASYFNERKKNKRTPVMKPYVEGFI